MRHRDVSVDFQHVQSKDVDVVPWDSGPIRSSTCEIRERKRSGAVSQHLHTPLPFDPEPKVPHAAVAVVFGVSEMSGVPGSEVTVMTASTLLRASYLPTKINTGGSAAAPLTGTLG